MGVDEIGVREAHGRLDAFRIVDVRSADEFHRGPLGRIAGAVLVPLPELGARLAELPPAPLLLVCRSGRRSEVACERLAAVGVGPVTNLVGGMIAWNQAGLPCVLPAPESPRALLDAVATWLSQVGSLSRDAAAATLAESLRREGFAYEAPTREAVDRALDFVEESLGQTGGPPDLDLALASFRRALAEL